MRYILSAAILFNFIPWCAFAQNGNILFDNTYVHEIRVTIDDNDFWNTLLTNYNSSNSGDHIYIPTNITIDGTQLDLVGFRIKGFSSVFLTNGKKKPFRIDFNEFVQDQQYDGIKKLSLNNATLDPSYMRDVLAFNIMRNAGVSAPRTAFTKIYLNDTYWGLYIMVEQVDKTFLQNHFEHAGGNLFKCQNNTDLTYTGSDPNLYKSAFELKTNETTDDWSGFVDFVRYANKAGISTADYRENFPQMFDMTTYLKVLAIDIILLNWDSYYANGRNFYLYEDIHDDKFYWIPWDYSFAFSDAYVDIFLSQSAEYKPLIKNILSEPGLRNQLINSYKDILLYNFTAERIFPLIDDNKALIREHLEVDPNKAYDLDVFDKSLENDSQVLVKDTIRDVFNLEYVYLYSNWDQVPESVKQSGIQMVDTTWYDIIDFDTITTNNEETIYVRCTKFLEYQAMIIGLKSFIQRRIDQVSYEVANAAITTGVDEIVRSDNSIVISPNPVQKFIDISGKITQTSFSVSIYDFAGRIVIQSKNKKHLDLENLSPGVYVIEVNNTKSIFKQRFIKRPE